MQQLQLVRHLVHYYLYFVIPILQYFLFYCFLDSTEGIRESYYPKQGKYTLVVLVLLYLSIGWWMFSYHNFGITKTFEELRNVKEKRQERFRKNLSSEPRSINQWIQLFNQSCFLDYHLPYKMTTYTNIYNATVANQRKKDNK